MARIDETFIFVDEPASGRSALQIRDQDAQTNSDTMQKRVRVPVLPAAPNQHVPDTHMPIIRTRKKQWHKVGAAKNELTARVPANQRGLGRVRHLLGPADCW